MWIVIKYKINEFSLLRKELKNKLGENTIIYRPKIVYQSFKKNKIIQKEFNILGDYFFCFSKKFEFFTRFNIHSKLFSLLSNRHLKFHKKMQKLGKRKGINF